MHFSVLPRLQSQNKQQKGVTLNGIRHREEMESTDEGVKQQKNGTKKVILCKKEKIKLKVNEGKPSSLFIHLLVKRCIYIKIYLCISMIKRPRSSKRKGGQLHLKCTST